MLEHLNRTISQTKSIQLQQYNIFSAAIFHIDGRYSAKPSCAALLATFWSLCHNFVPLVVTTAGPFSLLSFFSI